MKNLFQLDQVVWKQPFHLLKPLKITVSLVKQLVSLTSSLKTTVTQRRYIEIFKSSELELRNANYREPRYGGGPMGGGFNSRPSPYDRSDRYGGGSRYGGSRGGGSRELYIDKFIRFLFKKIVD